MSFDSPNLARSSEGQAKVFDSSVTSGIQLNVDEGGVGLAVELTWVCDDVGGIDDRVVGHQKGDGSSSLGFS